MCLILRHRVVNYFKVVNNMEKPTHLEYEQAKNMLKPIKYSLEECKRKQALLIDKICENPRIEGREKSSIINSLYEANRLEERCTKLLNECKSTIFIYEVYEGKSPDNPDDAIIYFGRRF